MAGLSKSAPRQVVCRFVPLLPLLALVYFVSKQDFQSHPDPITMSHLDDEVQYDFWPYLRLYKSGRVERLLGTAVVPPGTDLATGVVSKDVTINYTTGLAARLYLPANATAGERLPVFVYIHGGAFVIESAFSPAYHNYLNMLVAKYPLVVVSVDYCLAPEHPLPTAYDDAFEALNWVVSNSKSGSESFIAKHGDVHRLFIAGDSAGANIAHNVVLRVGKEGLQDGAKVIGMVLANPYFWGKEAVGAETTDAAVRERMESMWGFVCDWKYGIDHPYVDPTVAPGEWRRLGCSRVLVTVSELDLFRARGVAYVEGLKKSGWEGEVEVYETMGEDHCYHLLKLGSEKERKEMEVLVEFLRWSATR